MHVLPRIDIDAFVSTPSVLEVLETAMDDWRLSRVTLALLDGGPEGAAIRYATHVSPQLVIIEADGGAADMPAQIEQLAQFCHPDTRAIVIGQVNDVRLYRHLMAMGVSDYLVAPFTLDDLIFSIGKALDLRGRGSDRRLITVVGAKGGVGTTTIAQVLAWTMGQKFRETALLLDLNGHVGTAGLALGAEGRESIEEYILDPNRITVNDLQNRAVRVLDNLFVIAGGTGSMPSDQYGRDPVDTLLDEALGLCPNVVLDLPNTWTTLTRTVTARADTVVLVTTLALSSLRNAKQVIDALRGVRGEAAAIELVVNMTGLTPKMEIPLEEALKSLRLDRATQVAHVPAVFAGPEFTGDGFRDDKLSEQALAPLVDLTASLVGAPRPAPKAKQSRLPIKLKLSL